MNKVIYLFIAMFVMSCSTLDIFEKSKSFPTQTWDSKDSVNFKFEITDTSNYYNFYFVLRHHEKYPYKNIWLSLNVVSPKDTSNFKREFTLADNSKWLGATTDDITDHRMIFNPQPIKLKKGTYSFTIKQIMRENPLPYIFSAGIRVQKVGL